MTLLSVAITLSVPMAAMAGSSNFKTRLCNRVWNRFEDNERMLQRVNRRIAKRFGFICEKSTTPAQTPVPFELLYSGEVYFDFPTSEIMIAHTQDRADFIHEQTERFGSYPSLKETLPPVDFTQTMLLYIPYIDSSSIMFSVTDLKQRNNIIDVYTARTRGCYMTTDEIHHLLILAVPQQKDVTYIVRETDDVLIEKCYWMDE